MARFEATLKRFVSLNALRYLLFTAWLALAVPAAQSQVPQSITYQGALSAGAGPFSGTGLFTVVLGDTNMQPVSTTVFTNSDVRLRIWFNDGTNGFALLSPDQRLTSSGYAMMAANVPNGAVTGNNLAAGAVSTLNLATGAVTSAQLAVNAVTTPALANGSVTAVKLAPQAVTSPALAQGAVTSAQLAPASVTTPAIANGAITAATLAPNAVTASAIADGTISQSKLNFQLGYINARNPPFGAVGNGTNDDTARRPVEGSLQPSGRGSVAS